MKIKEVLAARNRLVDELQQEIRALERALVGRVSPRMFGAVLTALAGFVTTRELADILTAGLEETTEKERGK